MGLPVFKLYDDLIANHCNDPRNPHGIVLLYGHNACQLFRLIAVIALKFYSLHFANGFSSYMNLSTTSLAFSRRFLNSTMNGLAPFDKSALHSPQRRLPLLHFSMRSSDCFSVSKK